MSKDLKALSKEGFTVPTQTLEAIQVSALMRIADASELMAKNFLDLQKENAALKKDKEYWINRYTDCNEANNGLYKSISAYKGHVNRLKAAFASLKSRINNDNN